MKSANFLQLPTQEIAGRPDHMKQKSLMCVHLFYHYGLERSVHKTVYEFFIKVITLFFLPQVIVKEKASRASHFPPPTMMTFPRGSLIYLSASHIRPYGGLQKKCPYISHTVPICVRKAENMAKKNYKNFKLFPPYN